MKKIYDTYTIEFLKDGKVIAKKFIRLHWSTLMMSINIRKRDKNDFDSTNIYEWINENEKVMIRENMSQW